MMQPALRVIIDTGVPGGRAHARQSELKSALADAGVPFECDYARSLREVSRFAAAARERDDRRVIVVGTDRTFGEAAAAVSGSDVALGAFPATEPSVFARMIGTAGLARDLIEVYARARPTQVDVLDASGRFALMGITIGLEADRAAKRRAARGVMSAFRLISDVSTVARRRAVAVKANLDEEVELSGEFVAVSIVNAPRLPRSDVLWPLADPADRRLDLCLISDDRFGTVWNLLRLARTGGHVASDRVSLYRASSVRLSIDGPFRCAIDAQEWKLPPSRINVEVRKDRLSVLAHPSFAERSRLSP